MNRLDFYNEMILRENIRKAIRLVRNKRQETLTEETKLRNIIRNLISEDASETEGPTMNTGGNALDQMLLNTNTLPPPLASMVPPLPVCETASLQLISHLPVVLIMTLSGEHSRDEVLVVKRTRDF